MSICKAIREIAFVSLLFPLDWALLEAEPKRKAYNRVLKLGCCNHVPTTKPSPLIVATNLPLGLVEP